MGSRESRDGRPVRAMAARPFARDREREGRESPMKQLKCRDAGFDCEAVVEGRSVDEVMDQVGPHVTQVHGVDVTPELAAAVTGKIRDV